MKGTTYEIAKKTALKLNGKLDSCNEYEKAYHFFKKDNDADGDNGVVIVKETGRAINWMAFIMKYHPERTPKQIEF